MEVGELRGDTVQNNANAMQCRAAGLTIPVALSHYTGCFFFTGTPLKSLKYKQVNLG